MIVLSGAAAGRRRRCAPPGPRPGRSSSPRTGRGFFSRAVLPELSVPGRRRPRATSRPRCASREAAPSGGRDHPVQFLKPGDFTAHEKRAYASVVLEYDYVFSSSSRMSRNRHRPDRSPHSAIWNRIAWLTLSPGI